MDADEAGSTGRVGTGSGRKAAKFIGLLVGLGILAALVYAALAGPAEDAGADAVQTAVVRRRDLTVRVTEGGTLRAMQSLKLRNEAPAPTDPGSGHKRAISQIVEEGTVITPQDVEDGMVLARLESADLEDRERQAQIWVYGAEGEYARARGNRNIQEKQNETDVAEAELDIRVARLELERYLGEEVAARLVADELDFADMPDTATLGGVAQGGLRARAARVELATGRLAQAEQDFRRSKRLRRDGWITEKELTADELAFNRRRRELEAAREELRLFKRYTLLKEAKRAHSDYVEKKRALARITARARSRLAQAEAALKSAGASYKLQQRRLQELRDGIEKCTIRAPRPGRVIYASTTDPWRRDREAIREGQKLWPTQSIILIPDLSTLAARVRIHENDIQKMNVGQPATVHVEAMPDEDLTGEVAGISTVASGAQMFIGSEVRIYEVDVALDRVPEGLTPGMSATAEIVIAELNDVLCIPKAALNGHDGRWTCTVEGPEGPELRRVDIGRATENHLEITRGLSEGDVVFLGPAPELAEQPPAEGPPARIPMCTVERGDFAVSVTERGAVYSMEPLEMKSKVEGWNTLSKVVDEGTMVTQKDVEEGMVLAQLDSARYREREAERRIDFYEAEADQAQAAAGLEIQRKQNESDVAGAELREELARMELERYLGADLAARALEEGVGFSDLADDPALGGVARQELSNYGSQVELAREELLRVEERLSWTRKLWERKSASRNELTGDQLSVSKRRSDLESAGENLRLFKRYTLPKEAERRYSDCMELERDLARVKTLATSRLTQAEARLSSREAVLELSRERLEKVRDTIEKCTIRAPKPGRVVYGSRSDPIWYRMGDSALRPGASVEENRTILRIPDPSTLAALVNVPEAKIQKVEVGQPAVVTLEAVPGRTFPGRVTRISPVASSSQAWINPDAKVYETEVALEETPGRFIPGMSAMVEIVTARAEDVLYLPAQAVTTAKGYSICWVEGANGPGPRAVQIGYRSDVFVQVEDGLKAGERVYLAPPPERADRFLANLRPAPSH